MSVPCLMDTNVLIDFLNDYPDAQFRERFLAAFSQGSAVSVVTVIELLGWCKHTEQSRQSATKLLECLDEFPLERRVVAATIELRSRSVIHLGDAIIAATALTHGLPLMTRNIDDFRNVDGLTLINPFEAA
ncbi:MAG: type II toxin-antitoxin system VapC family toxin [Magnetococcales bacterium]|nr:type II toxin-antitoxin system VapC family toxin [Magnetococcales bacterium]